MSDDVARTAAAALLAEQGFPREAAMVLAGEGDDFAEMRMARALLRLLGRAEAPAPKRFERRRVGEEC